MAIDFPSNPSAGATYSYGGILWTWNSTAWDKTTSGSQGNTGLTGPTGAPGTTGNTGHTGPTGAQGEPGQSSNYYNYKVHTSSQTTPTGNGEIRYNNASQTGSTLLYIDHLDSNGDDIDVFLSLLKQNDNLIIQDANNSNNYQTWKITSAPTVILNDFTTIPVTGITSAGTGTSGFDNNHQVLFIVFSSPIATAYVESFNGLTGAVTGITAGGKNTFTQLNTFSAGISASGGVTFTGNVTISGFTQGVEFKADSALITLGDINGVGNGSTLIIDDSANTVQIENADLLAGGATFSGNLEVNGHINMNLNGPATQLFTAKNSGGLKISHQSGKRITIGSGGVADRETYISVTENNAGVNNTGQIEFGWTRTDDPEADPVVYEQGNFVFPQSSGVTGDVLRVQSHDGNTSVLEWSAVIGVTGATGATGPVGDYVISFNSLTGAVTGVSRVNGFTGGITFAASTGITFTASAGTITLSTTGGGGSKTYAVYTPLDNQPPAANYATIDTRNSIMVLDFDAATDESAVFVGIIPEAASLGSGLKIRINWMATSATSGTCRWGVQIERMNTDEDSDSFDTAATAGSTTNATSGIITTTEITITTIDSVAAGDPFRIKVFRDADGTSGTDDMTGDAELVSVEVRSAA